LLPGEREEFYF